jgi:6,7-dimethyl-8-ribityllumazine synthase
MNAAPHLLIVEARFYDDIMDALFSGARAAIDKAGATFERVVVPGALEAPAAIGFAVEAAKNGKIDRPFDGFVALGCVIRGETTHYETVCAESARGLQDLALRYNIAIGNGILTVENENQAWARAKPNEGDKGGEAARAALAMVALRRKWGLGN